MSKRLCQRIRPIFCSALLFAGLAHAQAPTGSCLSALSPAQRQVYFEQTNTVYAAIAQGQNLSEVHPATLKRLVNCASLDLPVYSLDARTSVQINIVQGVMTAWRPNPEVPGGRERAGYDVPPGVDLTEDQAFDLTSSVELRHRTD